ncbi:NADP-dependent oxidoreductase [Brachybacterium sacelli]|uniref:NADPH:quinone reductase-like Zn-dependent oxidoreductase n=1 Tax=Brachybacterium sacelli TaxID=173364 RepID=A0ABS4WZ33_9MICO|nr:NADP-dependent oxidoreductase [Brachybacterium sacelli]MBP2380769.1 NADPH:quinone reductase-like Zn-dependent oxidoreductase [Brachybacterium sacelli]
MRAIGVTRYGGPEALHEIDVPGEELEPGTLRVRVSAAAVSPTDIGVRSGARATTTQAEGPGDVPGMDVAGIVAELGADGEAGLAVGDRVVGIVTPSGAHGAYREEIVLPVGSVVRAPSGASDAEAATLPMNALTARHALDLLALEAGQTLAVTGAAGTLGGYLIQLARADGLTVVADAAEQDEELVRTLGADVVVRRGEDVAERIREVVPQGVDALADASIQSAQVLPAVADGSAVATFRGYRGEGERGLRVEPVMVHDVAEEREMLASLRDLAEQGVLTLRVADVLPAAEASEAHRRLEAGGVRGRLVLDLTA